MGLSIKLSHSSWHITQWFMLYSILFNMVHQQQLQSGVQQQQIQLQTYKLRFDFSNTITDLQVAVRFLLEMKGETLISKFLCTDEGLGRNASAILGN